MPIRSTKSISAPQGSDGITAPEWGAGALLSPGIGGQRIHAKMGDGEPVVAQFSGSRWQLVGPTSAAQAAASANPMPPGDAPPLLADHTYLAPGSLRGIATVGSGGKGFCCDLVLPGIANTFTSIEIFGVSTRGGTYDVIGAWVGPQGSTDDITEDITTGFVTIFDDGRTIPAGGTEASPVIARLTPEGGFSIAGTLPNAFRLIIELGEGAELRSWGVPYVSVGWSGESSQHVTPTRPSVAWNLDPLTPSFGQMPNIIVGLRRLSIPVATIPLVGDSVIETFGDDGGINGRRGLGERLATRWTGAGKPWVPLQMGLKGLPTPSILSMWEAIVAALDLRCVVYEGLSINNWNDDFGYPDPGARALADAATAQSILPAGAPCWYIIPGTWVPVISGDAEKAANFRATVDAVKTANAGAILDQADGGIWDSATLEWLSTYGFADGGHLSTDGYDELEYLISAPLAALIDAAA